MSGEAQTAPRRDPCPDPGLIAAHAERRLAGDEAARMDAHLASCSECYEVFAETLRFDLEAAQHKAAWSRRPLLLGLAIAASVILAFFIPPFFMHDRVTSPRALPPVAELAQAIGSGRFIEPRLASFQYGRRVVLRSGDRPHGLDAQPPAVLAAVARIRERAENDPSPEVLGALGITYLVSGDANAAVKALESATSEAPENAWLLSDLAAAYLARATQADEPADIPKALESAEKAIALAGAPEEAWFNRALALESLHLVDAARKAWEDYLRRDSSSGWADEARQHLERLAKVRQSSAEDDGARARAAVEEGPGAIERLADEDPQALRSYLEDEVFPAWAEAYLAGRADAGLHGKRARLIGDELLRTTGDAMPRDAARALAESAATAASHDPLRAQALGYRALREANRLYAAAPSCSPFQDAVRHLDAGGSPYASWARREDVLACRHSSQPGSARAELQALAIVSEKRGYLQLLGRVRWVQGLVVGDHGQWSASLEQYQAARAHFEQTRDPESVAFVLTLLAEDLHLIGEGRSAWRHRLQAFERFSLVPTPRLRHGILTEALLACLDERLPRTALQYGTALIEVSRTWSNAHALSEALVRRASVHHVLGADDLSSSDLRDARGWISRISDKSRAERLQAEVEATEGEILVTRQPETAARALERSLAYYRLNVPIRLPALQLSLARAQAARGLDDAAQKELLTGIQIMESQRRSVEEAALQVSFFDQAQGLFDEMVRLQVERRRDPDRALSFVERAHGRQLADSLASDAVTPLEPEALQGGLPDGLALVYYVPFENGLYIWALSRERSHFIERSLPAAELSRLVAAHRVAIERRASLNVVRQTGARLHDELVRPLIPFITSQRALIFIPDGTLQSAVFAGLWNRDTDRYLVEDYLLGVAPSGTVFVRAMSRAARPSGVAPSALVVGNPRVDRRVWANLPSLPEAEAEAEEVASLYKESILLTGGQATKRAFIEATPKSQIVHYAGHAAANASAASSARLFLAADPRTNDSGALYLHELERSKLPRTRAVVLAACRTGAGAVSRVEGALSLARPFLAAGVPDVVASLWDIDDRVGRRFFVAFHRSLLAEGDPILALRKAQLALLRSTDSGLQHPASWAAFICVGGLDPDSLSKEVAS